MQSFSGQLASSVWTITEDSSLPPTPNPPLALPHLFSVATLVESTLKKLGVAPDDVTIHPTLPGSNAGDLMKERASALRIGDGGAGLPASELQQRFLNRNLEMSAPRPTCVDLFCGGKVDLVKGVCSVCKKFCLSHVADNDLTDSQRRAKASDSLDRYGQDVAKLAAAKQLAAECDHEAFHSRSAGIASKIKAAGTPGYRLPSQGYWCRYPQRHRRQSHPYFYRLTFFFGLPACP